MLQSVWSSSRRGLNSTCLLAITFLSLLVLFRFHFVQARVRQDPLSSTFQIYDRTDFFEFTNATRFLHELLTSMGSTTSHSPLYEDVDSNVEFGFAVRTFKTQSLFEFDLHRLESTKLRFNISIEASEWFNLGVDTHNTLKINFATVLENRITLYHPVNLAHNVSLLSGGTSISATSSSSALVAYCPESPLQYGNISFITVDRSVRSPSPDRDPLIRVQASARLPGPCRQISVLPVRGGWAVIWSHAVTGIVYGHAGVFGRAGIAGGPGSSLLEDEQTSAFAVNSLNLVGSPEQLHKGPANSLRTSLYEDMIMLAFTAPVHTLEAPREPIANYTGILSAGSVDLSSFNMSMFTNITNHTEEFYPATVLVDTIRLKDAVSVQSPPSVAAVVAMANTWLEVGRPELTSIPLPSHWVSSAALDRFVCSVTAATFDTIAVHPSDNSTLHIYHPTARVYAAVGVVDRTKSNLSISWQPATLIASSSQDWVIAGNGEYRPISVHKTVSDSLEYGQNQATVSIVRLDGQVTIVDAELIDLSPILVNDGTILEDVFAQLQRDRPIRPSWVSGLHRRVAPPETVSLHVLYPLRQVTRSQCSQPRSLVQTDCSTQRANTIADPYGLQCKGIWRMPSYNNTPACNVFRSQALAWADENVDYVRITSELLEENNSGYLQTEVKNQAVSFTVRNQVSNYNFNMNFSMLLEETLDCTVTWESAAPRLHSPMQIGENYCITRKLKSALSPGPAETLFAMDCTQMEEASCRN